MGSLKLEASDDGCSTYTTLWSKSGNQGNSWRTATVETAHQSSYSCIRFVGVTANSYRGDIGLDDVTVVAVLPPTPAPTMTPNPTPLPTMTLMPTAPQTDCLTVKSTYTYGYHHYYGPFLWTLTSTSTSAVIGTGQAGDGTWDTAQVCHAMVKPGECYVFEMTAGHGSYYNGGVLRYISWIVDDMGENELTSGTNVVSTTVCSAASWPSPGPTTSTKSPISAPSPMSSAGNASGILVP